MIDYASLLTLLPAVPPVPETEAASAGVQSVWDFVVKGGWMMVPIGLCSLVAMTIVAERLLTLRRTNVLPAELKRALRPADGERIDPARIRATCRDHDHPVARIVAAGFRMNDEPRERRVTRMEETAARELTPLRRNLRVLSVIAAVAPLMGLLGTIFGMIRAFQTVAVSGEALGKTELLAAGIYEAMITTAGGLIVAIPVMLAYHWLSSIVQRRIIEVDGFVHDLLDGTEDSDATAPPAPAPARIAPETVLPDTAPAPA